LFDLKLTYDFVDTFYQKAFPPKYFYTFCFKTRGQKFTLRSNSDLSFAALASPVAVPDHGLGNETTKSIVTRLKQGFAP